MLRLYLQGVQRGSLSVVWLQYPPSSVLMFTLAKFHVFFGVFQLDSAFFLCVYKCVDTRASRADLSYFSWLISLYARQKNLIIKKRNTREKRQKMFSHYFCFYSLRFIFTTSANFVLHLWKMFHEEYCTFHTLDGQYFPSLCAAI